MRRLLFIGKSLVADWWHSGYYVQTRFCANGDRVSLIISEVDGSSDRVDPDTVSQYIEMDDKTGRMIFENKIVRVDTGERDFDGSPLPPDIGVIRMIGGCWCVSVPGIAPYRVSDLSPQDLEVIGNVFDDPELLTGGGHDENG